MALENKKILLTVFKYLNGLQLSEVAHVCSFWKTVAEEEKKRRDPFVFTCSREVKETPQSLIVVKKKIIDECTCNPQLNFFFIETGCDTRAQKECHCKLLPPKCFSVSLETSFSIENESMIKSMFFPKLRNIKISKVSLNEHSREDAIYCKELNLIFDIHMTESELLKALYDTTLRPEQQNSVCMIALCDQLSIHLTDDIFQLLENWYPTRKISVWGGMLHKLTTCYNDSNNSSCKDTMNFISILLSGKNMETWCLCLGPYYENNNRITYKFRIFSVDVHLKRHSVAFMFTSYNRGEKYYFYEASAFEKFFPEVPLYKICGIAAIGGINIKEAHKKIMDHRKFLKGKETTFLIITYDT